MAKSSDNLIWFLGGAAVGATLAVLYAPQSGEETRRFLGDKIREGRDAAAEAGRNIAEKGRQAVEYGRSVVSDVRSSFDEELAG